MSMVAPAPALTPSTMPARPALDWTDPALELTTALDAVRLPLRTAVAAPCSAAPPTPATGSMRVLANAVTAAPAAPPPRPRPFLAPPAGEPPPMLAPAAARAATPTPDLTAAPSPARLPAATPTSALPLERSPACRPAPTPGIVPTAAATRATSAVPALEALLTGSAGPSAALGGTVCPPASAAFGPRCCSGGLTTVRRAALLGAEGGAARADLRASRAAAAWEQSRTLCPFWWQ